ncbi:uncharacterized protein BDW43DRAFT_316383 [Aspergillus alliaceus]|uniref:uncharacterized protein n=1 Tax=Petromyces alliaceus TaxID=209559 RepID=UPI0012A65C70|nr:uncharacterized protein BDW43DRAFT_316383 [Aspergillus alliaceus]KAB8227874.1 hypothetical protein BDW43DRAFT_316383 [Aspergillus alliaceus]
MKWELKELKAVPLITRLRKANIPWKIIRKLWYRRFRTTRTIGSLRGQWYRFRWGWVPKDEENDGVEKSPPASPELRITTEPEKYIEETLDQTCRYLPPSGRQSIRSVSPSPEPSPVPVSEGPQTPPVQPPIKPPPETLTLNMVKQKPARPPLDKEQERQLMKMSLEYSSDQTGSNYQ